MNKWSWLAIPMYTAGYIIGIISGIFMNNEWKLILGMLIGISGLYLSILYMDKLIKKEMKENVERAIEYNDIIGGLKGGQRN